MTKIPVPEVIEFLGWHEWAEACAAMDEMGDFAITYARAQVPLIDIFAQTPLEIQSKPMANVVPLFLQPCDA